MTKFKGLLLTEGMHGMISQVEGLAKALNIEFTHHKVELNNFWELIPPKFTPISKLVFKTFDVPDFDIIISCGRKSVVPSIYIKKNSIKKVYNIHIQDPKVSLSNFDFIIAPEHDGLSGNNVLTTKGAIHYISKEEIINSKNYLIDKFQLNNYFNEEKLVTIILGGPNKYYSFNDTDLIEIFEKIKTTFINTGHQAIVIPSIRTPQRIINLAKKYFDRRELVITEIDKKAYLAALGMAKYIVVTCDSTSMISESAITGKPIYVAHMKATKQNLRFKNFFDLFRSLNIIRNLGTPVENWSYENINETNRIAEEIKKQIS